MPEKKILVFYCEWDDPFLMSDTQENIDLLDGALEECKGKEDDNTTCIDKLEATMQDECIDNLVIDIDEHNISKIVRIEFQY